MTIELGKQYRTRDGLEVRIYAVDGVGPWPVHGAIKTDGVWRATSWTLDGHTHFNNAMPAYDLVEVRPRIKREVWVNVYRHDDGSELAEMFDSREDADCNCGDARIACVRLTIDCEEGEGL